jgi:multidrug efflux system membrane fusion protein
MRRNEKMKRRLENPGQGMKSQGVLVFAMSSLVGLALTSCSEPVPEKTYVRPVKTVIFGEGSSQSAARSFPGRVQAAQQARLSFRVAGPLIQLPVFEGQEVKEGDILARLDPRDYQTAVSNLQARVADLKAQYEAMKTARPEDIRALEAALTGARARLLEAEATLRRYRRLYENDNVAKAEYDQRRAARDVAEADVRTAEESLTVAREGARPEDLQAMEARIQAMEAELRRSSDQLADTTLRAPYDGIVAEVFVENFEFIQAQQEVLSLQNVTVVEVVAQVPEVLVAQARREGSQPDLVVRFQSLPGQEFPARLTEIAGQSDPVTRTFAVTLQVQQPEEGNILAGMTAEVSARKPIKGESGLTLPVSALVPGPGGSYFVWVLSDESMETRQVTVEVGDLTGDQAVILSGLKVGDRVITAGASSLSAGQQVRLITDELRERR